MYANATHFDQKKVNKSSDISSSLTFVQFLNKDNSDLLL